MTKILIDEALRLAFSIEGGWCRDLGRETAAELRRLHQSEREGWRYADELEKERKQLQAMLNAERGQSVGWAKDTGKKLRITHMNMEGDDGWRPLVYGDTTPPAPAQELVGFDEWWSNEGSQAPKPTDDMYEHCKRMCEIAWSNGAYRALEKAAQQKPAVAAYWAVVDWDGKHIQVDQDTMQLEVYETKHHAKANVNSRTKAMLVYISATPPAPAQPLTMVEMVDAAMVATRTIYPPITRSQCETIIRAAAHGITGEKNG
jgi:hypothetical protein